MENKRIKRFIAIVLMLVILLSTVSFAEELYTQEEFSDNCESQGGAVVAGPVEDAAPELEEFTLDGTQTGENEQEEEGEQAVLAPPEAEYTDGDESMEYSDGERAVAAPASGVAINASNFPDAKFREYVKRFDSNSDGWLSTTEREAVTEIRNYDGDMHNLEGIQYFINLETLDCSENTLQILPLNSNTKLKDLRCSGCGLNTLDLSLNTKLEYLDCSDNNLTSLDVSMLVNLIELSCGENGKMRSLKLGSLKKLEILECWGNGLSSLDVASCSGLTELDCASNSLTSLDLTGCPKLITLFCSSNRINSLNVSRCAELVYLSCGGNKLKTLEVRSNTKLQQIFCLSNAMTSIDISTLSNLIELDCSLNELTALDVSKNAKLRALNCQHNPLGSLDISNCSELIWFVDDAYGEVIGDSIVYSDYDDDFNPNYLYFPKDTSLIINGVVVDINNKLYTPLTLSKLKSNGSVTLSVDDLRQIEPVFATNSGWTVKSYKSSKPKVASIDGDGRLTAKAEGTTKITVTTKNKKTATITVKVVDPFKPTGVSITQGKSATLNMGQTLQLKANLAPVTAISGFTWKSSKPKVANVNGSGLVTPLKEGTTKITVTTRNKKSATITIKVVDPYKPTGVRITQGQSATLSMGQTLKLGSTLAPSTAQTTLTWKSNKPKIASVNSSGLVTPLKEGTTKITVTTRNRKSATITIKVVDPYKPTGVSITQGKSATLTVGETLQLRATLSPATAQSGLTWKSSKSKVAKVDSNGLVTAIGKGTATITVTTRNGKKATCKVTVKAASKPSTSNGRIELTNYLGVKFSSIRKALGVSNYGNNQIWFGSIGEPTGPDYAEVFCIENDPSAKYSIFGLNLGMSLSDAEAYLYSRGWEYEDDYSSLFDDASRTYVLDSSTYTTLIIAYNTSGKITKLYVERI